MSGYDYAPEMQDPGDGDMFGAFADAVMRAAEANRRLCASEGCVAGADGECLRCHAVATGKGEEKP